MSQIQDLAQRVAALAGRMRRLAEDFSVDLADTKALQKLLIDNPIEAFIQAKGMGGVSYFEFDGQTFGLAFEIQDPIAFATLIREILDWRLAQYLSRGQVADVVCSVSQRGGHAWTRQSGPVSQGGGYHCDGAIWPQLKIRTFLDMSSKRLSAPEGSLWHKADILTQVRDVPLKIVLAENS